MNYYRLNRLIVYLLSCYIYRCVHIEHRSVSKGYLRVDPILECGNKSIFFYYEEKQRDVLARAKCLLIVYPLCYLAYLIGGVDTQKVRVRSSLFI